MGFFESLFKVLTFGLFTLLQDWLAPETPSEAIKTEKNGSNKPIPVNYGENILGAIKIHKYVTDTPEESDNDLLHIIAVFCEGEVESVDELFFNEISENDKKFNGGRLAGSKWYEKHVYTGTPSQPASAAAVSGIPNWTIDHKLSGLCYAYIVLQLPFEESEERRDVWRGEPQITARIKGKKVYDPRTATTAFSANPALCIRDFITNPIYGLGLPESFVVDSEIVRIANACDEGVSTTQTITEYIVDPEPGSTPIPQTTTTTVNHPRFSCNLVLQTKDNPLENFNKILRTFRGIAQDMTSSAKLSYETTIEETYGVGTTVDDLFHFNADTMLDDFEFDSGDIKDRFNVVEVKFRNRLKEFEEDSVFYPDDSDPLKAQWLAEDNGIEQKGDFNVSGITSKAEALQWAEIVAKRSRFNKSVSVTGMPITIKVEVGDIVAVDSQMNGWTKKPFRVMEKELQDDDSVSFKLREHEDAIYPWSGRSFSDTIGGTWLGDPNNLAAVTGITLTPDPTLSKTGTLSWLYGANAFIRGYQVRLKDGAGNLIYDVQRPSRSWLVPLIDAGSYVAEVYAVSTTGATSPTAAYAFTLAAPVQPSSITLTPRDWEIEAAAQLAGIGLGTVFEYDIVEGDGTGYTPASKGRASTFTFTGLLPDTLYTVFARAINAYGISAWISASATTMNTGAQVEWIVEPIQEDLDWLNSELDGVDALLEQVAQDISEIGDRKAVDNNLTTARSDISKLNNETLPTLQNELDAAEADILTLEGKFPITETSISDSAISTPKLAANAVTAAKIIAGAVTTDKMTANSINGDRIAANTLAAAKIIANSITAAQIAADTITGNEIAANTITASEIAALTITAAQIAAETITGNKIVARTIGADRLVANSITADEIAALTITAAEIEAGAIVADKIDAGAVTADKLNATAIYGKRQVLTSGNISVVTDPGAVELTSDLVMWVGDSANTTPASRTKNNSLFYIGSDNTVSSNISGGRTSGQLIATSNSGGGSPSTTRSFTMKSNRGQVELTGLTGWVNITSGLSFSGNIELLFMDFSIRNVTSNTVLSTRRIPMTYDASTGSAYTNENNVVFLAEDDLSATNYADSREYRIEMKPVWTGSGSITGTWPTSAAAGISHPKVKAYQFVVTF